jgi:acetate kinase
MTPVTSEWAECFEIWHYQINLFMILTINSGSSSIKFALFKTGNALDKVSYGALTRIGLPGTGFTVNSEPKPLPVKAKDYTEAIEFLLGWLEKNVSFHGVKAIGHRIVHGMHHTEPGLITNQLLDDLKNIRAFDPDHLPYEVKLIEAFKKNHPETAQFACFDTDFHKNMPRVAKLLPIPRRFDKSGIHRYGFHGLSYNYLMLELEKTSGKTIANGRIILAHLGSGASMAAVKHGKSIDTSMGFTPDSGLPMSSRTGDLDPGVAWFMMKSENLSPKQFNHLISRESGLLGISETSGDMHDLLKLEETDVRAAEAVSLFCYQVKKWIGAFAAALGGIDTLVFTGGIGENAPEIRARICEGLGFLGIELNDKQNKENASYISANGSGISIRVIHTDEEMMIAKLVYEMTGAKPIEKQNIKDIHHG